MQPMTPLTLDALIDALTSLREILPGDTPMVHALDDEGEAGEPLGDVTPGFLLCPDACRLSMIVYDDDIDGIPDAQRVVVLWPMLPEVTV